MKCLLQKGHAHAFGCSRYEKKHPLLKSSTWSLCINVSQQHDWQDSFHSRRWKPLRTAAASFQSIHLSEIYHIMCQSSKCLFCSKVVRFSLRSLLKTVSPFKQDWFFSHGKEWYATNGTKWKSISCYLIIQDSTKSLIILQYYMSIT